MTAAAATSAGNWRELVAEMILRDQRVVARAPRPCAPMSCHSAREVVTLLTPKRNGSRAAHPFAAAMDCCSSVRIVLPPLFCQSLTT